MACSCVDDDGKPRDKCLGLCLKSKIVTVVDQEKRDLLMEKIDYNGRLLANLINEILPQIRESVKSYWKDGFMEGIEFAMNNDLKRESY